MSLGIGRVYVVKGSQGGSCHRRIFVLDSPLFSMCLKDLTKMLRYCGLVEWILEFESEIHLYHA